MEKLYEIHAAMNANYVYRVLAKNPVLSNEGRTVTYVEIGHFGIRDLNYYSKPREAIISNCPFQILEYVEE